VQLHPPNPSPRPAGGSHCLGLGITCWGGLVGDRGHRKGHLRVLGSSPPSVPLRTSSGQGGAPIGGGGRTRFCCCCESPFLIHTRGNRNRPAGFRRAGPSGGMALSGERLWLSAVRALRSAARARRVAPAPVALGCLARLAHGRSHATASGHWQPPTTAHELLKNEGRAGNYRISRTRKRRKRQKTGAINPPLWKRPPLSIPTLLVLHAI
jgi:hypothetical protein